MNISDLDEVAIDDLVRAGIRSGRIPSEMQNKDISDILSRMKLLENGCLNNAAAVLFIKDSRNYPQFLLRMARFRGIDKREFIDNRIAEGNIFKLLQEGESFLFKHLNISGKFVGKLQREENLSIPYEALREALINAFAHRDYRQVGGSVSLAIYDNRVEIVNIGTLPHNFTVEMLLEAHESHTQNPLIAQTLYYGKFLENWGRGIQLICDECQKANIQKPTFETDNYGFKVIFERPEYHDDPHNDPHNDPHDDPHEKIIIDLIKTNPKVTRIKMAESCGVSESTIKRILSKMKDKVVYVGSGDKGHWELK